MASKCTLAEGRKLPVLYHSHFLSEDREGKRQKIRAIKYGEFLSLEDSGQGLDAEYERHVLKLGIYY